MCGYCAADVADPRSGPSRCASHVIVNDLDATEAAVIDLAWPRITQTGREAGGSFGPL